MEIMRPIPVTSPANTCNKADTKALLKQQYENFSASSSESLDSIFNRLQRLVSRLAILGVITPPEDLNVKFLRSLPSEWDTHVVKKLAGASNDDKNLAFLTASGASSTNDINTVNPEVSTATTKVKTASTEISTASFSDATVYAFLFHINHKGLNKTAKEEIQANMALMAFSDSKEGFEFKIAKFDKSAKDLEQLLASQITDKSKKGFGYNAVPSPHPLILNRLTPLDLSYSGLEEFKEPEVNEYGSNGIHFKATIGCDKESNNSMRNTDELFVKKHQKTDTETCSVKSSLKVDKDWKEKFFCPANHS
ncbi:hypothetical protein Tco_0173730 [Tanacetum coccineum]